MKRSSKSGRREDDPEEALVNSSAWLTHWAENAVFADFLQAY